MITIYPSNSAMLAIFGHHYKFIEMSENGEFLHQDRLG
jgi:hypothetical protein